MTVSELIEKLKAFPPDAVVALSAMGHHYDSKNDERSHGPLEVFPFLHGRVVVCQDAGHNYRDVAEKLATS